MQTSFVDDAELEAFPAQYFNSSSDSDSDDDNDANNDNSDSSDDSPDAGAAAFALTDAILDAHFADTFVGTRPSKYVEDTDSGEQLLRTSAVAMVSGRAKLSRDRCVKYKKRKKD